jgi:uncharacterized Zn-finger protein
MVPQPPSHDPFGGAFSYPSSTPANPHVPAPEEVVHNNPFDEFATSPAPVMSPYSAPPQPSILPPPPSTVGTIQPPPIDDFDALFNGTPTKSSQSNNHNMSFVATVSNQKDSELEDFFATLDVSK